MWINEWILSSARSDDLLELRQTFMEWHDSDQSQSISPYVHGKCQPPSTEFIHLH